jgi:hypothetical protein
MALDFVVDLECETKRFFGDADALAGTVRILALLKARNRAAAVEAAARREGVEPGSVSVEVRVESGGDLSVGPPTSVAELEESARPLVAHEALCSDCPANVAGTPYGCFGALGYPIARGAEAWLMARLETADRFGGRLCLDAIERFGYTGEPVAGMRDAGLFESPEAISKAMGRKWLRTTSVSSDQILQAFFAVGALSPGHCLGLLLWLGALHVDGQPVDGADAATATRELRELTTPEAREARTSLALGELDDDPEVRSFQALVSAIYRAWRLGVPVLIDA